MSDLFNTGVRPAIDDYLLAESQKVRDYGGYWSASSAGYCMRKNIFERLNVPHTSENPRQQRLFSAGHIFHDWIQDITKKAGLSIASEVELQDEDLMVRGHFDDLILVGGGTFEFGEEDPIGGQIVLPNPKHLILYDYKTVNSRSFMWAKKNGNAMSHFHRLQLGTYMMMLRKAKTGKLPLFNEIWKRKGGEPLELTEARILKIEKENLMMMEQQLLWDKELETDVLAYWTKLHNAWKSKKLPECTCADFEGGFMAKEQYNPFFFNDQPCSIDWYLKWKKETK